MSVYTTFEVNWVINSTGNGRKPPISAIFAATGLAEIGPKWPANNRINVEDSRNKVHTKFEKNWVIRVTVPVVVPGSLQPEAAVY